MLHRHYRQVANSLKPVSAHDSMLFRRFEQLPELVQGTYPTLYCSFISSCHTGPASGKMPQETSYSSTAQSRFRSARYRNVGRRIIQSANA